MTGRKKPIHFEGIGLCYYRLLGKRFPKKGEYYLSGAIVQAWRARNDLRTTYVIVRPTFRAVRSHMKGEAIE